MRSKRRNHDDDIELYSVNRCFISSDYLSNGNDDVCEVERS